MKHTKLFLLLVIGIVMTTMTSCWDICDADYALQSTRPSLDNDAALYVNASDITSSSAAVKLNTNGTWTNGTLYYWAEGQENSKKSTSFSYSTSMTINLTGLQAGTKYYVQYVLYYNSTQTWSRTISFTTSSVTSELLLRVPDYYEREIGLIVNNNLYDILMNTEGYYKTGVNVTNNTKLYVFCPFVKEAKDTTAIPITDITTFTYGTGYASGNSPSVSVSMAHPSNTCSVSFEIINQKAAADIDLTTLVLRNSSSSTHNPIATAGTFNFHTLLATATSNHDASFTRYPYLSMAKQYNSTTVYFTNLFPTNYPYEAEVSMSFSDTTADPVTLSLENGTIKEWEAGKSYKYTLNVSYTAKSVELYIGSITVEDWKTGTTSTITVNP